MFSWLCISNDYIAWFWSCTIKPPSDGGFIKAMWSYLIGIWIINCFVFITSPVVLSLILTWSFFKVKLTTWGWLQIQLCKFSINYFVILLQFFLICFYPWYVILFSFYSVSFVFWFHIFTSYRSFCYSKHIGGWFHTTTFKWN